MHRIKFSADSKRLAADASRYVEMLHREPTLTAAELRELDALGAALNKHRADTLCRALLREFCGREVGPGNGGAWVETGEPVPWTTS